MHGRGQGAEVEESLIRFRDEQRRHQRAQGETEQREQDEGGGKYQQMQSPVADACQHRFAREFGAVHEEEQGDGGGGEVFEEGFADALRRYDGGGKYHQQNHDEEGVEMQAAERVHGRGGGCEGGEYNKACCARTRDKPAHKKRATQAARHAS